MFRFIAKLLKRDEYPTGGEDYGALPQHASDRLRILLVALAAFAC